MGQREAPLTVPLPINGVFDARAHAISSPPSYIPVAIGKSVELPVGPVRTREGSQSAYVAPLHQSTLTRMQWSGYAARLCGPDGPDLAEALVFLYHPPFN